MRRQTPRRTRPAPLRYAGSCSKGKVSVGGVRGFETPQGTQGRCVVVVVAVPRPTTSKRGGQRHLREATSEPKRPPPPLPSSSGITNRARPCKHESPCRLSGATPVKHFPVPQFTQPEGAGTRQRPGGDSGARDNGNNGCLLSRRGSGVATPRPERTSCIPDPSINPKNLPQHFLPAQGGDAADEPPKV